MDEHQDNDALYDALDVLPVNVDESVSKHGDGNNQELSEPKNENQVNHDEDKDKLVNKPAGDGSGEGEKQKETIEFTKEDTPTTSTPQKQSKEEEQEEQEQLPDDPTKIFLVLHGLMWWHSEADVRHACASRGQDIQDIQVFYDPNNGKSYGIVLIEFGNHVDAGKSLNDVKKHPVQDASANFSADLIDAESAYK
eukprot:CAMPEP_0184694906 /NCGR_PEP_ID=MMETSP0313-20130426/2712_1 /TAXON_ID=2792 /ORGANISM="Porphyridium aerugineum, Strain SAG 1380-2" /LENGTH=194 /DNA_ID=CAMNT_0027153271 /DNA_START=1385 /DNA_END=1966 /DNA_ORIENTATION=-